MVVEPCLLSSNYFIIVNNKFIIVILRKCFKWDNPNERRFLNITSELKCYVLLYNYVLYVFLLCRDVHLINAKTINLCTRLICIWWWSFSIVGGREWGCLSNCKKKVQSLLSLTWVEKENLFFLFSYIVILYCNGKTTITDNAL